MSKQRSTTQSTSGRGSESSTTSGAATPAEERTQYAAPGGKQSTAESTKQKPQNSPQTQQKPGQGVESGLAKGKTQAAETLNTVAESLVVSSQQLRQRNQERIGRFVDQTANRVQRVSKYLQNTDVNEIVEKTEEFARRRPALFLGGTFVLGILGARFLKSSRRNQEQRIAGSGQRAAGSGQGYSRGRGTGVEREVPASRPQDEWAAAGGRVSGLGDVADPRAQTQPIGDPGFGRGKGQLEYGERHGPGASERL